MKSSLSLELQEEEKKIKALAESMGLDFYDTIFEMIDYKEMNQIAAYGGFPVRYPHWKFGMEYDSLSKSYEYGLSKIYELVINNDPCIAYLLEGNSFLDQKLVMAHVYGHADFFKHNKWFSQTEKKMVDKMANHATRIRRYIDRYGINRVEKFIDTCLSIDNLIDRHGPYSKEKFDIIGQEAKPVKALGFEKKDYLESYMSKMQSGSTTEKKTSDKEYYAEKDILKFLISHAPLENWEQDILSILRDEAYYFAPQGMTKIMNEGWASYWHAKMMTEHLCSDNEIVCFCDTHSGTMAMSPNGFNPYKIGIELFRDIERRWDRGQFGIDWFQCDNMSEKANWNKNLGLGKEKIFEVRRDFNDVMFIDHFLTEEFCVENKFFVYKFNEKKKAFEIDTKDFKAIKAKLLFQLTNFGQPIIQAVDANFENKGELLLTHMFEGVELQPDYMNETLKRIQALWKKPVSLATVLDKAPSLVTCDGQTFEIKKLEDV